MGCLIFQNGGKSAIKKKKISPVPVALPREDQLPRVDVTWKEQLTFHLSEPACKSATLRILVCAKHARGGSEKILGQVNSNLNISIYSRFGLKLLFFSFFFFLVRFVRKSQLNLGSEEAVRESRQHWRQMLKEKIESSFWHKLQMASAVDASAAANRTDSISSSSRLHDYD